MQINRKIKEARELKGFTQEQIADAIDEKRTSYSGWEKEIMPSFDIVLKISRATGMPLKEFIAAVDEDLAKEILINDDNSSFSSVKEPDVKYDKRNIEYFIELKTASGKPFKVRPEGKTEITLLNAFLEERDSVLDERNRIIDKIEIEKQARIDELIKEKENLNDIIKGYLIEIRTNSKEIADDLTALTAEVQAEHRAMMDSIDVAAEQPIGTTAARSDSVELASQEQRVGKGKKAMGKSGKQA